MTSLDDFAVSKLEALARANVRRSLLQTDRLDGLRVKRGIRTLLSFSCNDYLNLTHDPRVKAAAMEAITRYGAGAGASRLVTGNHPLFAELEAQLSRFKGAEATCLFGSGYLANAGIVPVLVGASDLLLVDELAHSCLWAGARLSSATVRAIRHNDVRHLEALLKDHRGDHRHALIVTDGVFSIDGDLAPLTEICALARRHDAWVMTDDAHGLGVLADGRGSSFVGGTKAPVDLQMGTLSNPN